MRITLTDNSEPQDFLTSGGTVFLVSRNLTLDNTIDTDSGTYTCAASNVAVTRDFDFELIVQGELYKQLGVAKLGAKLGVII